jgi:predicted  nucleic acid-binding Zn-ribbon protein
MFCQEERELTCDACYELSKEFCGEINISPGLTPNDTFYLQIINQRIQRTSQLITINEDGSFDIDLDSLQDGFFNPYSGKYELYLSTTSDGEDYVDMTLEEDTYKCIVLTITITNDPDCC